MVTTNLTVNWLGSRLKTLSGKVSGAIMGNLFSETELFKESLLHSIGLFYDKEETIGEVCLMCVLVFIIGNNYLIFKL